MSSAAETTLAQNTSLSSCAAKLVFLQKTYAYTSAAEVALHLLKKPPLLSLSLNGISMMAQMAQFSFSCYFPIPNSEFRNLDYEFRNCEVYVI